MNVTGYQLPRSAGVCADRIPDARTRERFVRLLLEAAAAHSAATAMRREAWAIYRQARPSEGEPR
jgi:hypothetical protein